MGEQTPNPGKTPGGQGPRSWEGWAEFEPLYQKARPHTVVSVDRCWVLYSLARQSLQLPGNLYETGVFRGGTAIILGDVLRKFLAGGGSAPKTLRLFDTFEGMPETDSARDLHKPGDFSDTDIESVKRVVGTDACIAYHRGFVPDTFFGLEDERICFAHVDVDIYRSILDACAFIYPRLSANGYMLFDDYGFPTCPGARQAVDEFFDAKPETPLVLPTGQAIVTKSAG